MTEMFFKISEAEGAKVYVVFNENGLKNQKTISYDDFVSIVTSCMAECKTIPRIGALPKGFVDGGYSIDKSQSEAIIKVPSGKRPLYYKGRTVWVNWPDVVFRFRSDSGKITQSYCYFSKGDDLYHYPFGNVYGDSHICWGGNPLPKIEKLCDYDKATELFFSAETNNDLYMKIEVGKGKNSKKLSQEELIELIEKNNGELPEEVFAKPIGKLSEL